MNFNKEVIKTKKISSYLIALFIGFIFLTACTKENSEVEVYSISGKNERIAINNGMIIVSDEIEKFIAGDLLFQEDNLSDVKDYSFEFYFYDEDEENGILTHASTTEGAKEGAAIPADLGEISSQELFSGDDFESIKDSLTFSIKGERMNGETFNYNLELTIEKVY